MKILVCFGDSDFSVVMRAFGEILVSNHDGWDSTNLTKEMIVKWFNTIAGTLYEMVQQRPNMCNSPESILGTHRYLQSVTIKNVYFDDEVDIKMKTWNQWGNGDSVLIDNDPFVGTPKVTIL